MEIGVIKTDSNTLIKLFQRIGFKRLVNLKYLYYL
jgi:hypothetical protein